MAAGTLTLLGWPFSAHAAAFVLALAAGSTAFFRVGEAQSWARRRYRIAIVCSAGTVLFIVWLVGRFIHFHTIPAILDATGPFNP